MQASVPAYAHTLFATCWLLLVGWSVSTSWVSFDTPLTVIVICGVMALWAYRSTNRLVPFHCGTARVTKP